MHIRALLFAFCLTSFFFSSCSKKDEPAAAIVSEIPLNTVSEQGCLNVAKLYPSMRGLNPGLPVLIVPTSISFTSEVGIRDNFRKLISYGQLVITQHPFSDLQSFPEIAQDGCSTFTIKGADGIEKVFKVTSSTAEFISGTAENGEILEYKWISTKILQTKRRYLAYDAPCSASDKPIFVTIAKTLDWNSPAVPATIPERGSLLSIDYDFLSLAAQAVGDNAAALYVTSSDGSRSLDVGKVTAMTQKPPRADVLSCTGYAEPVPEPTPNPDHPGHDGGTDYAR